MSFILNYFIGSNSIIDTEYTVAVAESVTAGALSVSLCSKPGASKYYKGGAIVYSVASKKEILDVDTEYAESHNFANPFTTSEMAKAAVRKFKSRIGIATTGYSLPTYRPENKDLNECELDIKDPYAYICLYDALTEKEIIKKFEFIYDPKIPDDRQRAEVQAKVAIEGSKMYHDYIKN